MTAVTLANGVFEKNKTPSYEGMINERIPTICWPSLPEIKNEMFPQTDPNGVIVFNDRLWNGEIPRGTEWMCCAISVARGKRAVVVQICNYTKHADEIERRLHHK